MPDRGREQVRDVAASDAASESRKMNQFNWYAAYTYPRHEKKVHEQLVLREIESFLPCSCALHKWRNGCKVEVQSPLFPGYLFVRIRFHEQLRVLQVPNLVNLISFGGLPVALPTEEIEALRAILATLKAEPHPFLKIGDRVRIKSGCLAGIEGILLRKATGFRFVLNIELIMQAASVEVRAEDVEPIALASHSSAPIGTNRHC
jgi:transcription termination/antitermination protein NusG